VSPAKLPEKILVVATQRIGDVLLTTPLIRSLRRAWPQAQIDALVFESTKGILAANPDLHEVITTTEQPTFGEHARLYRRIWRAYDVAISTMAGDRPTLYAWAAGHERVGALLPDRKSRWKRRLLSHWVEFDNLNTHAVLMNLKLVELLDVPKHYEVVVSWSDAAAVRIDALLSHQAPNQRLAVLHLYPKFNYKMWHAQGWSALAHRLTSQGLRIVLSGSDSAEELYYIEKILPLLPQNTLNLAGQLNLEQLACLLSRAAIYIGPDTAVTHIAAAVGVPTVALYGPSNPVKWGPWPKNHREERNPWKRLGSQRSGNVVLIQGQGACVPCLLEGCDRNIASFSDCLQELAAEKVIAAAEALLQKHSTA
jgi:heptosyltransferase III